MVKAYTDEELLGRVTALESFKEIPKGRWILGVRSIDDLVNKFDDKFYEFEHNDFIRVVTGTTNPGLTILKGGFKKFNKQGAAVLKADEWYYNVWQYGLHRGKMPSLRQLGNKMIVFRDGDMDGKSEELGTSTKGYYGINYHTNTYDLSKANQQILKEDIFSWSAGCQVVNDRGEYVTQMDWYKNALDSGRQKYVTYCLINEF